MVEALGGHWDDRGAMCRCPAHDDRTPSLSVRLGRRQLLFHCFAGCDQEAVLRALRAANLSARNRSGASAELSPSRDSTLSMLAARLWSEARPAAPSPAGNYLRARGFNHIPSSLRYHSRTPYGRAPLTVFQPAMIAAVRDNAGLVGIHRTFFDPGRPGLALVKRALGRLGGGTVRLSQPAGGRLGLAEGVETALAATQLTGVPCWATLGTERFRHAAIPASVRHLVLFLDNDAGGQRAERLARDAHAEAGRWIEARYPERANDDWNDVLLQSLGVGPLAGEESEAVPVRTG